MIYLLYHRRKIDDEIYDDKLIGVYSSQDKVTAAVKRCLKLPGFSDYPSCFQIEEFSLHGKLRYSNCFKQYTVYLFFAEKIIDNEEVVESYDICTTKAEAILQLLWKCIHGKSGFKKRYSIDRYFIDEDNWCEGFVTMEKCVENITEASFG